MTWVPPADIDPEIRDLCVALNRLPGIETTESCCGHGDNRARVWFGVTDWDARGMLTLARCTCPRYHRSGDEWTVCLYHGDTQASEVSFLLESKARGERAYAAASRLTDVITNHIEDRIDGFNILLGR